MLVIMTSEGLFLQLHFTTNPQEMFAVMGLSLSGRIAVQVITGGFGVLTKLQIGVAGVFGVFLLVFSFNESVF